MNERSVFVTIITVIATLAIIAGAIAPQYYLPLGSILGFLYPPPLNLPTIPGYVIALVDQNPGTLKGITDATVSISNIQLLDVSNTWETLLASTSVFSLVKGSAQDVPIILGENAMPASTYSQVRYTIDQVLIEATSGQMFNAKIVNPVFTVPINTTVRGSGDRSTVSIQLVPLQSLFQNQGGYTFAPVATITSRSHAEVFNTPTGYVSLNDGSLDDVVLAQMDAAGDVTTKEIVIAAAPAKNPTANESQAVAKAPGAGLASTQSYYSEPYYAEPASKPVSPPNQTSQPPSAPNPISPNTVAPIFNSTPNQSVAEGQTLTFSVHATDPDTPLLNYGAVAIPSGSQFSASNQTFTWTPLLAGTYVAIFSVSDGTHTVNESVPITVTAPNQQLVSVPTLNPNPPAQNPTPTPDLQFILSSNANTTLIYKGATIINNQPLTPTVDGGGNPSIPTVDATNNIVTWDYPWGTYVLTIVPETEEIKYEVTVSNTSSDTTLQGFSFAAGAAVMPGTPTDPAVAGGAPIEEFTESDPGIATYDWAGGTASLVSESSPSVYAEIAMEHNQSGSVCPECRTIQFFTWNNNANQGWPTFTNPIGPGQSMSYSVSLRFNSSLADAYASYAQTYPYSLTWSNHQPIGRAFPSGAGNNGTSATNPRSWFGDPTINVFTPDGWANFRTELLQSATDMVTALQARNAQGVVVWDIEGYQYPNLDYVGDPIVTDQMAPELASTTNGVELADEYFKIFTNAGLKVGVTLRDQDIDFDSNGVPYSVTPPDEAQDYINKIAYAENRWGATIFYIDSTNTYNIGQVLKKVLQAHPEVLLIPEHYGTMAYAYSAPYGEMRGGTYTTPQSILNVYPQAFGILEGSDGYDPSNYTTLVSAVHRGDIIMSNGVDLYNTSTTVLSIYQAAASLSSANSTESDIAAAGSQNWLASVITGVENIAGTITATMNGWLTNLLRF